MITVDRRHTTLEPQSPSGGTHRLSLCGRSHRGRSQTGSILVTQTTIATSDHEDNPKGGRSKVEGPQRIRPTTTLVASFFVVIGLGRGQ